MRPLPNKIGKKYAKKLSVEGIQTDSGSQVCMSHCGKARHDMYTTWFDQSSLYFKYKSTNVTITAKQHDKTIKNFKERKSQILLAKKRDKNSIRKCMAVMSDQNSSDIINDRKKS